MKNRLKKAASFLTLSAVCGAVFADINTSIKIEEMYDDNIYRLESREVDAWITRIKPGVELITEQGASTYTLALEAESGIYSESKLGEDDYTDYSAELSANWAFNVRNRFDLGAYSRQGHDDRGTGRMDVAPIPPAGKLASVLGGKFDDPDVWVTNGVEGEYTFGAPNAKGAFSLSASYEDKDYTNNGSAGAFLNTDVLDKVETEVIAQGLLKVLSRTSVLLEVRAKQLDYDVSAPTNRDSDEMRYFVGVQWKATAKTTGSVLLGYQDKDPDDNTGTFDDFSSTAWEADVTWAPRTYSSLNFTAFRGVEDSSDAITYVDREVYTLSWSHNWSSRLSSKVFAEQDTQDYKDASRDDTTNSWGFSTAYEMLEWLEITGEYRYEDRDSSVTGLDYRRNMLAVGAELSFE